MHARTCEQPGSTVTLQHCPFPRCLGKGYIRCNVCSLTVENTNTQPSGAACRQQSPAGLQGELGWLSQAPVAQGGGPEAQPHLRLCPTARSFCGAQWRLPQTPCHLSFPKCSLNRELLVYSSDLSRHVSHRLLLLHHSRVFCPNIFWGLQSKI